jgi:hypothetical protein
MKSIFYTWHIIFVFRLYFVLYLFLFNLLYISILPLTLSCRGKESGFSANLFCNFCIVTELLSLKKTLRENFFLYLCLCLSSVSVYCVYIHPLLLSLSHVCPTERGKTRAKNMKIMKTGRTSDSR